ncbi:MAG: MBL fold metallo-hydrolase RNA specificity domain-containing protein [Gammaproteobacteria bacterium]
MQIQFLGATHTVTGSKYYLTAEHLQLLVDCGLFQGVKEIRLRNREDLTFNPAKISDIILTHAHLDHSGYIPLLVKNGFRGTIYCTEATRDLCSILLPDSGYLQEEEAYHANKHGYSKHHPALPLYTKEDAEKSLAYFKIVDFEKAYHLSDKTSFTFHYAGHILGAATLLFKHAETRILFSGDLGRPHDPIMKAPTPPVASDYLVIESTYGDRIHDKINPLNQLDKIINQTFHRGGSVLIPAFAVGRAQSVLYYLHELLQRKKIPPIPIYLDSPMSIDATQLFCEHNTEHRLSFEEAMSVCKIAKYIHTPEESEQLLSQKQPKIIISASGMLSGGRVLSHLAAMLGDDRNTIIFSGFQAEGSLGARLVKGLKTIKIRGDFLPVKCDIIQMHNLSAHVDSEEMLKWLACMPNTPKKVFIKHGEPQASQALASLVKQRLHWNCVLPQYLQRFDLD